MKDFLFLAHQEVFADFMDSMGPELRSRTHILSIAQSREAKSFLMKNGIRFSDIFDDWDFFRMFEIRDRVGEEAWCEFQLRYL